MEILKKPVVTEKYTELGEAHNQYGFICHPNASKDQIKKTVERIYDVNVTKVRTMRYARENKTRYTKTNIIKGKTAMYKKAVITLAEGQEIDFYSNT
jgi:large subunit ribosomal protein L23